MVTQIASAIVMHSVMQVFMHSLMQVFMHVVMQGVTHACMHNDSSEDQKTWRRATNL